MFQRWRAYSLTDASDSKAGEDFAPRMIPFHVYDADGLILYGRVHNFESLEKRMDRTGWRPVYANIGSRRVGFGELWIMSYNDTTTGPYNELVINFVATNDPTKPAYQWSSPYSVLVPMNDPANRLFTPLLLLDENRTDVPKKKREGGPIAYGNNLLGTKKESATIEISQKGTLRRFGCNTPDGAPVLTGHVDVNVSALDSFTATCEMVRQFGFIATGQAYDQRTSNAELSGGIVNPQGGDGKVREIIAAYKFAPKVGLLRPDRPERFGLHWEPGTKFGGILEECGFEPVIFGHDPHLKTVLSIDSWPSPDDVELAARDATTFTRESGMREAR
jgi:hypothetical protein